MSAAIDDTKAFLDDVLHSEESSHGSVSSHKKDREELSKAIPDYSFPEYVESQSIRLLTQPALKLKSFIEQYSYSKAPGGGERVSYKHIRVRLLLLGIAMNLDGKIPPRYRGMRSPPKIQPGVDYEHENTLLSNDRQVIDLHWIYCKQMSVNSIAGYKNLFNADKPFDWQKASEFVFKARSFAHKSKLLGLSEFDELQLASIGSSQIKTRAKTIKRLVEEKTSLIRNYVSQPKCKLPNDIKLEFPTIYESLLIARGAASKAVKSYNFLTTKKLSLRQMSRYSEIFQLMGLKILDSKVVDTDK